MRGPHVGVQERGRGYRFGAWRCWAVGSFWLWAGMVPGAQFHIFPFFLFFFSIFLISFTGFAKYSKSIQTIFRNFSKNHHWVFKSVGKQVFKNQNKIFNRNIG
jgi:hypothetical protein